MSTFNQLFKAYISSSEFNPYLTANLNNASLVLISLVTMILLMITLTFNAKTSSIKCSILNFVVYTILSALSALSISFTILFIASKVGVYT